MEEAITQRRASFIFVFGVLLWGGGAALSAIAFDWYVTRHAPPLSHLLGRFAINGLMGIPMGWLLWNQLKAASTKPKPSRRSVILRGVLFVSLMAFLAYALWMLAR